MAYRSARWGDHPERPPAGPLRVIANLIDPDASERRPFDLTTFEARHIPWFQRRGSPRSLKNAATAATSTARTRPTSIERELS